MNNVSANLLAMGPSRGEYKSGSYFSRCLIFFLILFLTIPNVFAGAPFYTSDPEPEPWHQFDIRVFSTYWRAPLQTNYVAPSIQLQYGILPNLELNVVGGYGGTLTRFQLQPSGHSLTDTQIGIVYQFLTETRNRPKMGIAPVYVIPTGNPRTAVGNGRPWYYIPLAMEKNWGAWRTYVSIGFAANAEPLMRNYLSGGWLVQKKINDKLVLGAELYSQGKDSNVVAATTLANIGGYYAFTPRLHVLASIGHNIAGANTAVGYLGFNLALGPL